MSSTTTITFDPPLKCATIDGDRRCGKDATAATLYPTGGGNYIMQPICRECVAALARVYLTDEQQANAE